MWRQCERRSSTENRSISETSVYSAYPPYAGSNHERRVYGEEYQIYTDQLPPFQQRPPNLTSTRAGDKIEFLDLEAPKKKKGDGSGEDNNPGGSGNEGGGGDEEAPDPTV